jgi:putative phage-type endonuclease
MSDKDIVLSISMSHEEYIQKFFAESPQIISDPNYITALKTNLRVKYYFDPTLEDFMTNIEETLKKLGKLRSELSISYPSIVKEGHLEYLKGIPQPEQKTQEWYSFRHDHITASNAWKALGTTASKNQLIYEKCQPLNKEKYKGSLSETPMSWGNKYEYLTSCLYEEKNKTIISSFGCIEHPNYSFLAASPDGIVTGENNYGRMIEIKNVVSREITGIPKKDYYIQMQLQMEVCDLDECDFVETKFIEYDTESDYVADKTSRKGVIVVFINTDNEFVYNYMPFDILDYDSWIDATLTDTTKKWFKNIYWKLEVYSCVLVKRQREWFQSIIHEFISIWDIIQAERVNGEFINRAPKKRILKNENKNELKPELLIDM